MTRAATFQLKVVAPVTLLVLRLVISLQVPPPSTEPKMRSVANTALVMVPLTVCAAELVMRSVPLVPLSTLKIRSVTTGVVGAVVSRM